VLYFPDKKGMNITPQDGAGVDIEGLAGGSCGGTLTPV
jgi:hypothetical protein